MSNLRMRFFQPSTCYDQIATGFTHGFFHLMEKNMRSFKSAKQAQRFLSAFGPISGHFQPRRHCMSAQDYHVTLQNRFQAWNEVTGVKLVS
jgi:putative transposase